MANKVLWFLVIFLLIVTGVLSLKVFAPSLSFPFAFGTATSTQATTTPKKATTTPKKTPVKPDPEAPLSARVSLQSPKEGSTVDSTFELLGKAPGNWFFEATFPIQVRDNEGNVIGRTHANALGEWMTTELVSFQATIHLNQEYHGPATLILMRDNPSGLPENDDSISVDIIVR